MANGYSESFFGRFKEEFGDPNRFEAPGALIEAVYHHIHYYNHERYHKPLDNLTPADVYFDRAEKVKDKREEIKQKTMKQRRQLNRQMVPNTLPLERRILS